MQVLVNARFLTQRVTGGQRYAREMVRALDELTDRGEIDPKALSFQLVAPRGQQDAPVLKRIPLVHVGRLRGHFWEQLELPWYARGGLLVNLCNTGPVLKRRQIVVIYDAIVAAMPRTYSWRFRVWYRVLLRALGRTSKGVVTLSDFSKDELRARFGIPNHKVIVTGAGADHMLRVTADRDTLVRYGIGGKPFVLSVSSTSLSKNLAGLLSALNLLGDRDFDVVLVGGSNPRVFGRGSAPRRDGIRHLGYVRDAELKALYEAATCFVYPSLYEGFGLPPLEAMACGCPVVASHAASLPEVCRYAAVYCDPLSPEHIADKIRLVMRHRALRAELRQRGLQRARELTWEGSARKLLLAIARVVGAESV